MKPAQETSIWMLLCMLMWVMPHSARALRCDLAKCIEHALAEHPHIHLAKAKISEHEAQVRQVRGNYMPRLNAMLFGAPMFSVQGDLFQSQVAWRSISDWGPYLHADATLIQPLYTFGRISAGLDAATAAQKIEEAKLQAVRNQLALDVATLYYTLQYAQSVRKPLEQARQWLTKAQGIATERYNNADGTVTMADLQKIKYGNAQLTIALASQDSGTKMAREALAVAVGLPPRAVVELESDRLARPNRTITSTTLARWLQRGSAHRPEWRQLRQGRKAVLSLEKSERLALAPVLFFGAQAAFDYAPTRDQITSDLVYDPYNGVSGGAGIGLKFDFDFGKARAAREKSQAQIAQIDALEDFAQSGIPAEIAASYHQWIAADQKLGAHIDARKAAQKWITFTNLGFETGTSEARDLLEGLVAYVESQQQYLQAILQWQLSYLTLQQKSGTINQLH